MEPHCVWWTSMCCLWCGPAAEAGRLEQTLISLDDHDHRIDNELPGGEQVQGVYMVAYVVANALEQHVAKYNLYRRKLVL